jgi:hypothetical protein
VADERFVAGSVVGRVGREESDQARDVAGVDQVVVAARPGVAVLLVIAVVVMSVTPVSWRPRFGDTGDPPPFVSGG